MRFFYCIKIVKCAIFYFPCLIATQIQEFYCTVLNIFVFAKTDIDCTVYNIYFQ